MKKQHILFLHLFYWLYFIWYQFGFEFTSSDIIARFQTYALGFSFVFINIITFYVNYFVVLPWTYKKQKFFYIVLGILVMFLLFTLLRYSIEEVLFPLFFGFRNYSEKTTLSHYLFDNTFFSYTTIFISSLIWFLSNAIKSEQEKLILIQEKKNSELQALKTQINPHFIFNTLNNIYSLVYQKSEKALPALEELSQLLRYSTKDLEQDYISLDKEIGYLESLIELEKLRIKNPELLIIQNNIQYPTLSISPMLLVPFVENAFKHGDFSGKGFDLKISDHDRKLHFYLHNAAKIKSKDTVSGIGIGNVRKRLEILYPGKHQLNIIETETDFTVDLKIDLTS